MDSHRLGEIAGSAPLSEGSSMDAGLPRTKQSSATLAANYMSEACHAIMDFEVPLQSHRPWIDADGNIIWSPLRVKIAEAMLTQEADLLISVIILTNVGIIIYETNEEAHCYPGYKGRLSECPFAATRHSWLVVVNYVFLCIYSLEALLCIFAWRWQYFTRKIFVFDFCICLGGWASWLLNTTVNLSWLRVLRVGRLIKALKIVNTIPELYMLSAGFFGSMRAMFFGGIILFVLMGFFSILMVQLVHPVNVELEYGDCVRCPRGFASVHESMLTLFQQIVAGDSWGLISVPVIEKNWKGYLLPFTQLVIGVGAMNLILAVVVDSAAAAREANQSAVLERRAASKKSRKLELLKVLQEMDEDNSGSIDRSEVAMAAKTSISFRNHLALCGVTEDELAQIIDVLTSSVSEDISYLPFCSVLDDIESADIRKTVVMTKLSLARVERDILKRIDDQTRILDLHTEVLQDMSEHLGVAKRSPKTVGNDSAKPQQPDAKCRIQHSYDVIDASRITAAVVSAAREDTHDAAYSDPATLEVSVDQNDVHCEACSNELQTWDAVFSQQTSCLRKTLTLVDAHLAKALQDVMQTASMLHESVKSSNAVGTSLRECSQCFFKEVAEHVNLALHSSTLRRTQLWRHLVRDLEDDVAALKQHRYFLLRCEGFFVESCANGRACLSKSEPPWTPHTPDSDRAHLIEDERFQVQTPRPQRVPWSPRAPSSASPRQDF